MPYRDPVKRVTAARERMRRLRANPAYQRLRYARETMRRHWRMANDQAYRERYEARLEELRERYWTDPAYRERVLRSRRRWYKIKRTAG